jgi:hypothetical protein
VGKTLEELRLELEGEAPIAFAVLVRALKGARGVAEEKRARGEERGAVFTSIGEGAGEHERDGSQRMAFFERQVARPRSAHNVDDSPALSRRNGSLLCAARLAMFGAVGQGDCQWVGIGCRGEEHLRILRRDRRRTIPPVESTNNLVSRSG